MSYLPALSLLLQGYLNPDWVDDYEDVWSAVDDFARNEPESARVIRQEVDSLLRTVSSEETLRRIVVNELRSGYLPEADGWGYRSWLEEVARRVERRSRGDE